MVNRLVTCWGGGGYYTRKTKRNGHKNHFCLGTYNTPILDWAEQEEEEEDV
jgi:hypothetical protein